MKEKLDRRKFWEKALKELKKKYKEINCGYLTWEIGEKCNDCPYKYDRDFDCLIHITMDCLYTLIDDGEKNERIGTL